MTAKTLPIQPTSNGVATPPPDIEVVNVTPELAGEWLAQNTHNRNLRSRVVDIYAMDMATGDWRWTGDSIKFANDGTLLDGQHRLHAIVQADLTVPMLVVRGLDNEAQDNVDGGVLRKFQDVLKLRGEQNNISLAALVRKVAAWEGGQRRRLDSKGLSTAVLLRTLEAHPELRELVQPAARVAYGCGLPASLIGLAWWVFAQIDEEDANTFMERLYDGQGISRGEPVYELRRTLESTKDVRGERSQTYLLAITIKAWNAYREGRTVSLFKWKPGGAKPEKFPEPI
jgi:hypothetical protein